MKGGRIVQGHEVDPEGQVVRCVRVAHPILCGAGAHEIAVARTRLVFA